MDAVGLDQSAWWNSRIPVFRSNERSFRLCRHYSERLICDSGPFVQFDVLLNDPKKLESTSNITVVQVQQGGHRGRPKENLEDAVTDDHRPSHSLSCPTGESLVVIGMETDGISLRERLALDVQPL